MEEELKELEAKEYVATLQVLRNIDFLKDVPEEDLKNVLFFLQKQKVAPNKTILRQGVIANRLNIIRQGSVVITTKNKSEKIVLAELKTPQYFGEISLLRPTSATATVTSGDEGADLIILSFEAMADLAKKVPDIKDRIKEVIDSRIAAKNKAKQSEEQPQN